MKHITVYNLPGWQNSGLTHWQTYWEQNLAGQYKAYQRVVQANWDSPVLSDWCLTLEAHMAQAPDHVVFVSHSLGGILLAHWVAHTRYAAKVTGALVVSPPSDDAILNVLPSCAASFAPMPHVAMPFKTIVVSSDNDPFDQQHQAASRASIWGSAHYVLPNLGHINADSQLGQWQRGQDLLRTVIETC